MNDLNEYYLKPGQDYNGVNGQELSLEAHLKSIILSLANIKKPTIHTGELGNPIIATEKLANPKIDKDRVALIAVQLTWETCVEISRWWKEEITGKRCVKNIIDKSAGAACVIGGGYFLAHLARAYSPVWGPVVGGVVGGALGYEVCFAISDWATQKIFGVPKEEALENAYRFLGLPCDATNNEINETFRGLTLKYHPKNGGNGEDWHNLQISMSVIKASKGEF